MGILNFKIHMDEQIFLARVAEQAERFEDMVNFLKAAIAQKGGEDFTVDKRNLLSVGFKNLIGSQRGAIRTIGAIEQNPKYSKFSGSLQGYKKKIEQELYDRCMDIVDIVNSKCMVSPLMMSPRLSSPRWSVTTTDTLQNLPRMR